MTGDARKRRPTSSRLLLLAVAMLAVIALPPAVMSRTARKQAAPEPTELPPTGSAQQPRSEVGSGCVLEPGEPRTVAKILDGETIALADGSEVRLVGALIPRAFDAGVAGADWPAERAARDALTELVAGRAVYLSAAGRRSDRWGRQLAQVLVERDGERIWVQAAMIAAGHARAYGLPDSFACVRELAGHETAPRAQRLGLWANPSYAVAPAEATRTLLQRRNTYQIVEGRVAEVATVHGHIYLNFGANWRDDFTAGIATARKDRAWLDELRGLAGRRLRVRGWIERQNGPYIAVSDPSQIEVIDTAPAEPAAESPPAEH